MANGSGNATVTTWRSLSIPAGETRTIEPRYDRIALTFWAVNGDVSIQPSMSGDTSDSSAFIFGSASRPFTLTTSLHFGTEKFGWRVSNAPATPTAILTFIESFPIPESRRKRGSDQRVMVVIHRRR